MLACPLCANRVLTHRKKAPLFDHLVGKREQPVWNLEAERHSSVAAKVFLSLHFLFQDLTQYQE
jgi:hypothetical protein